MRRLLRHLRGHVADCVMAPLLKGLEALMQLMVPMVVAHVVDAGIPAHDVGLVLRGAALLAAMGVGGYAASVLAQWMSSRLAAAFGTSLRDELFAHVMTLGAADVDRLGRASLATRVTSDAQQVQDGLNMFFRLVLRSPFVTVGCVVAAFLVDGAAGALMLAGVTAAFGCVLALGAVASRRHARVQRRLDDVTRDAGDALEGARVLRAFGQRGREAARFSHDARELEGAQLSAASVSALTGPLTYAVVNLVLVAMLWQGGLDVSVGALTQGQVVALASYVGQALVELVKLANLVLQLSRAWACARRVAEVLDVRPSMADGAADAVRPADPDAPLLELRDAGLAYPGASGEAVSHVSLRVRAGEVLGVVGGTGSGKSTLAALAARRYDATSGQVLVDGRDVRDLSLASLRRAVRVVDQDPGALSGTVASNLRLGEPGATDAELLSALDDAQAAELADPSRGGLGARVEAGGRNLSGGQRQRLAVARALVGDHDVVVLDDVTSALDFATAARLRGALARRLAGCATVVISQRVSAVRHADRILVMDDGRVAGCGTHGELLAGCEVYRQICASQGATGGDAA